MLAQPVTRQAAAYVAVNESESLWLGAPKFDATAPAVTPSICETRPMILESSVRCYCNIFPEKHTLLTE